MHNLKKLRRVFFTKEKAIIILTIFILINMIIWTSYKQSFLSAAGYIEQFPAASLEFYYHLFRIGTNPFLFMLLMLLLPNLIGYDVLHYQQSHLSYLIETRMTKKRYYQHTFVLNMITTFIVVFIFLILILLIIHIFYVPIQFNAMTFPEHYFVVTQLLSNNEVISLILFIVMTSLGYALISSLLFSIQVFIYNKYIYRCCGVVLGILLVVVPALIQGFLFLPDFAFLLQINNLVSLGIEHVRMNPFSLSYPILYLTSFIIYGCLSYACFCFMIRWRQHYD